MTQLEDILISQQARLDQLEAAIDKLSSKKRKDSNNSSKPPSSDPPYSGKRQIKKPEKSKGNETDIKRRKGAQPGHKGHQQVLLAPTETHAILPSYCSCGCTCFDEAISEPFYTHQNIELPPPQVDVRHYVLYKCQCPSCGQQAKAEVPQNVQTGFGPRFSAFVAEMSGPKGLSRLSVQNLIHSMYEVHISTGAIQNIIDRATNALAPIYQRIAEVARSSYCNYVDETSWKLSHDLCWLWVMANKQVGFYRIATHRSKQAFEELVEDWNGILISDGYALYQKWINHRQTCIPHLIRRARGLSERRTPHIKIFGGMMLELLQCLIHFAKEPPDEQEWTDFYQELMVLLSLHGDADDDAGVMARHVFDMLESLWVFLDFDGIEPSNNRAERALRMGVLWRKRSLGTQSEKGNRWVESILSLVETCRIKGLRTFDVLNNAIRCHFENSPPCTSWI
ncbi:IS66 family transposase [Desulfoluna sp.]|uniref:IS66 family transposase n=1 Tax=Desulfoluna sp. TaxID=2045199 RepID=UPI00261E03AC|nr:IS66 family transposase [Desulfoluna sp.]